MKAKSILKDQKEHSCKYLDDNVHVNFSFIPLVLERNPVAKTPQCKIKSKNKKCKKLRPKKLRAYIPNEEQALSPVDLLKWQDKNILIIGKPGVGKTTVVQEMLRLWSEKDGREIDYMFYFDESVLAHSSNIASLQSILFDVYLKPMENDRMDVFKDIEENSENVVLILDGVTDFGKHSILWKIMNHELLPDAKIVITCRSEVEYDPLFRKWPTQKVYVQGFSKESINTYYHTMLGHDPVLLEVVLKNQELFSLSHVPLYASMIVDLMQFKNGTVCDHPHTVTEMYIHIFRAAVKKQIQQIDKYLKEIKDQVYYLMENAFNATMQKTLNVISCDETDISRAFLKMITIRDSPTSAMTYCAFLHNTMQEFFSALWLLGHPDEIEKVLQLCQTEEHKHMRHVLPFLCGLLSEHNIRLLKCLFPEDQIKKTSDWFIEKLLDTFLQPQSEESEDSEEFDLLFVSQCLYELQSPKACLMFLEKMDHQLEPEEDLDPHQCCALSYVIAQSRDKEVYLNLEDCTIADVGMNMMLSCSPNIRLNICKEPLEQATFFLEFFHKASQCCCSFFDQRYNYNHEPLNALLDLCSHVKNYETQTGRSFLPALQSVFQSAPDVWIIDLSRRKSSVLLEVLKLQTEKKPVELIGCSEEESEVMSFLQCLPYISQLRISHLSERVQKRLLLELFIKAAEIETQTGEQMLKLLTSGFIYSFFPYRWTFSTDWSDFLLIFYSHVKDYETQTGRSLLPALQSVFQSTPDVWIIDLSQRKSSVLLEVLKLQTEKKPVELRGCSEEESEVMSLLQCLPYISQLRFYLWNGISAAQFVLKLFIKAAEIERQTGEQMLKLLSSVCTYSSFPYERTYRIKQSDFLLDLCSHVKDYETQTGWIFLPALQKVFQSAPDVWIIDFSQRKSSVLLEVLKLRTENKPVELFECSEEESEMMSFLQCLPYISQLRFFNLRKSFHNRFLLKLFIKAAEIETQTGEQMLKLLSSVCTYSSFPYKSTDIIKQVDFLLDLCSHVKDYETQTGRSLLPGLQSVFQLPDVWIIDLSQRKSSVLLEVLKLQTEKKPVELIRCSEEESEMISLLQCLPYISQLSCSELCLLTLVKVVQYRENPELVTLLLEVLGFSFSLEGHLPSKTCRSVGRVLPFSSDRLNLTLKPKAISLKGTRLLFRHIKNLHTLRLSGYMVVRIAQALRSMWVQTPVTVYELTLNLNMEQWSERKMSRVLSNLAIILRLWTVQCLNLTEYKMLSVSLSVLLCHQGPVILRLSKETLRKLVEFVCEAQEEELTQCFLQKVGGDLTSCSLSWEELHYFLQHKIPHITVDLRKSNIGCNVRKMLPFFNRIQFKRISSTFMLSVIREIYESGSVGFVSSLLSSVENYINLQSRELDSVHCAALRFTLQHCTAVSLNLQWTSIPEEELESILPLFTHVSHLSVDRLLLRKMMHCCSVSDIQQETAAVLLSILQHKLDFSCCSALDLTANTDSEPLHLTIEDCCVMSRVIQSAHSDTKTQLILQDCEINTAGIDQLFPVLHSVKLCCAKSLLLQFLAHVRPEEAKSLSQALGEELNLSQTQLNPQVCRGLKLILEYSEGLTELDLSQCCLTDDSLGLLLPNLHKVQNIDFSGNSITDFLAPKIYSIVTRNSNIKTVRLFNNKIELKELFRTDPRFEIW
uniref:NACHT domain-containing protein n=1 Tax=Cyprinus carpio TaxID=7962 RepID=A0A8C1UWA8_CYPCA